jgi:hypothetical protein
MTFNLVAASPLEQHRLILNVSQIEVRLLLQLFLQFWAVPSKVPNFLQLQHWVVDLSRPCSHAIHSDLVMRSCPPSFSSEDLWRRSSWAFNLPVTSSMVIVLRSMMARWWWCQKAWLCVVNDRPVGKPQEQGLMNIAASFSLSNETKVINPVGGRQTTKGDAH